MLDDLEFALGLAEDRDDGRRPYLVEACRRYLGGKQDARVFLWSTGRIGAFVSKGEIRLERQHGTIGSEKGLRLSYFQLKALARVIEHWSKHREEWAAWSFHFGGVVASYYYQPPGARSKEQHIGSGSTMGGRTGQTDFFGKEDLRALTSPIRLGDGVVARQLIWRSGEKQGPPEGHQVGLVYRLPGGVTAKGYRDELEVKGRGGDVVIEPWSEPEFIKELLAVLERDQSQRDRSHEEAIHPASGVARR